MTVMNGVQIYVKQTGAGLHVSEEGYSQVSILSKLITQDLNEISATIGTVVEQQSTTLSEIASTAAGTSHSSAKLAALSQSLQSIVGKFKV